MFNHKESEKLVKRLVAKVMRRLLAAGAPPHIREDIEQEMWVAWCIARDTFDETKGAAFSTYVRNGIMLHINRWAEKHISRRHAEVIAKSLDAKVGDDPDGASLGEAVACENAAPDEAVLENDHWQFAMQQLDPKARQFMTILRDQPPELIEEIRKLEAKAEYARSQGHSIMVPHNVSTTMVFELMGIGRFERVKMADRIRKAGKKIQELTAV
ncbi:sigma factor [Mesorhizobium sp.]|uniref:sigma factor n=1 Tax=Mesorhizobium sp. TaxID=1871066 RepID=UPI00257E9A89|nr:sigma factor [Mesorhizobium sp.]